MPNVHASTTVVKSPTLTPAYYRLYYQLSTDDRLPTTLTDEGYRDLRRPSGQPIRTNTTVHLFSDDLKIIGKDQCVRGSIASEEMWIPIKYVVSPGSGTGGFVRDQTRHEKEMAAGIISHIEQYGGNKRVIDLVCGESGQTLTIKQLAWAAQAPSQRHSVKADLVLYTADNWASKADTGRGNLFLSLKDTGGADKIRQYSGVTSLGAGAAIANHAEVRAFEAAVVKVWKEEKARKSSLAGFPFALWASITDDNLKLKAVLGPDYAAGKHGLNAVDFFCQGGVVITSSGKPPNLVHTMTFTEHMIRADRLSAWFDQNPAYMPVLALVPAVGRSTKIGTTNIPECRLGIWPYQRIKGQLYKKEVGNTASMAVEMRGNIKRQMMLWNEDMKKFRRLKMTEIPFEQWLAKKQGKK